MKTIIESIKSKSKNVYWLLPFIFLVIWTMDTIISIFTGGFVRIDAYLISTIVMKIAVLITNLIILDRLFIRGDTKLYHFFKTYCGYLIVFIYVFYALPRLSLGMDNIIDDKTAFGLWLFTTISALWPFIIYWMFRSARMQIKWGVLTEQEYEDIKAKKAPAVKPKKTVKDHIEEWVHIIVQAIITVIIIQHFFFQLYEIPSESMVPEFLVRDRVFVNKLFYGPTIPLTKDHLPWLTSFSRYDIVVFKSPEYVQKSTAKKIFKPFIFYITLSLVDIDRENGNPPVEMVVKRLIGLPGEKVKMIDDVVYIKKKDDADFKVLDDKKYSHTNLFSEPEEIKRKIDPQYGFKINKAEREMLTTWDNWKRDVSLQSLNSQLTLLSRDFQDKTSKADMNKAAAYFEQILQAYYPNYKSELDQLNKYFTVEKINPLAFTGIFTDIDRKAIYSWPISNEKYALFDYDHIVFWNMLKQQNSIKEFIDFILSSINSKSDNNLDDYQLAARKLNLKMKSLLIQKYSFYLDLYLTNTPVSSFRSMLSSNMFQKDINELSVYIERFYDFRNCPEYPVGEDNYIPDGKYFLMGDNRYNSLDFRFDHKGPSFRPLDKKDPQSIVYASSLSPYLLDKSFIIGKAVLRIFPFNRLGTLN